MSKAKKANAKTTTTTDITKMTKAQLLAYIAQQQEKAQQQKQTNEDLALELRNSKKEIVEIKATNDKLGKENKELRTKAVRRNNSSNRTSKGQKFTKNENTAFDILVFLFQTQEEEMRRMWKGKRADIDYDLIVEFMQTDERARIGDRWAESRFCPKQQKEIASTYINFPNNDWNYKTSKSNLGYKSACFGFYTNVSQADRKMYISLCTEQTYRDKGMCVETNFKRHEIFMSFINQDRDGDFTKEMMIQELNDLK